jgi:hypothetical protein
MCEQAYRLGRDMIWECQKIRASWCTFNARDAKQIEDDRRAFAKLYGERRGPPEPVANGICFPILPNGVT